MPNRTFYIKEEDVSVLNKAQEMGGESISSIIAEALRRYVAEEDARRSELEDARRGAEILDHVVADAIRARASDIHIQPLQSGTSLRIRIDGTLRQLDPIPDHLYRYAIAAVKDRAGLDRADIYSPQEGSITVDVDGRKLDLRVAIVPSLFGEAVTLRILDRHLKIPELNELEPDGEHFTEFSHLLHLPYGLVFVTGPTGSGKTTTLYSMLSHLDRKALKVMTVENPVEVAVEGCVQIPVDVSRGGTFYSLLRQVLRCDPNVILVGEIRDLETARLCIESAITGHLVLSVLHAPSAPLAFIRLLDLGIEAFLIRDAVRAIVGEALLRRLCHRCRETCEVDEKKAPQGFSSQDLSGVKAHGTAGVVPPGRYFHARGCDACSHTGYHGLLPVYEVLQPGPKFQQALLERPTRLELQKLAGEEGMRSLVEDALAKAQKGLTSTDEVLRLSAFLSSK